MILHRHTPSGGLRASARDESKCTIAPAPSEDLELHDAEGSLVGGADRERDECVLRDGVATHPAHDTAIRRHDIRQPLTALRMNLQAAARLLRLPQPRIDAALEAIADCLDAESRVAALLSQGAEPPSPRLLLEFPIVVPTDGGTHAN